MRKVQAVLENTFGAGAVGVVPPRHLAEFIGPRTRVVGISGMDPADQGFVSRTLSGLLGWRSPSATTREFDALVSHPVIKKWRPRVLVGGAGAWPLFENGSAPREPVDGVVIGEAERSIAGITQQALDGGWSESRLMAEASAASDIPAITRASIYGIVEITRGCGRGCHFCSPTARAPISFPLRHILAEKSISHYQGKPCASMELGIEIGGVRLISRYMRGTPLPYASEDWPDVVVREVEIMNRHQVYPLATLILGIIDLKNVDRISFSSYTNDRNTAFPMTVPWEGRWSGFQKKTAGIIVSRINGERGIDESDSGTSYLPVYPHT